jgi:hypothetical protein
LPWRSSLDVVADHTPGQLLWASAMAACCVSDLVFWWRQRKRYRARFENYQLFPSLFEWKTLNDRERRHMAVYWLIFLSLVPGLWLVERFGL